MEQEVRLNKFLSEAGVCSRREADRMVERGRILVDGIPAKMGQKVRPSQKIEVDHKVIQKEEEKILLAFNKPRGVVCTTSKKDKDNKWTTLTMERESIRLADWTRIQRD